MKRVTWAIQNIWVQLFYLTFNSSPNRSQNTIESYYGYDCSWLKWSNIQWKWNILQIFVIWKNGTGKKWGERYTFCYIVLLTLCNGDRRIVHCVFGDVLDLKLLELCFCQKSRHLVEKQTTSWQNYWGENLFMEEIITMTKYMQNSSWSNYAHPRQVSRLPPV